MNIYTEVANKVASNREEFRCRMMQLSNKELYDNAYKIMVVESFAEMFCSAWLEGLDFLEEPLKYFNQFDNVLEYVYLEWLSTDEYFTESWDEMAEWLYNLYKYTVE